MNKEKLEKEHAELKARLAELVDFINSEEYYKLPEREKTLVTTQRSGMEVYLNALSVRLWGESECASISPSSLLPLLMTTILTPSYGTSSYGSSPTAKGIEDEKMS